MWDFLDKMNYNLLYQYAGRLTGNRKHLDWYVQNEDVTRNNWYYLIWFVYYYVLGCTTLEQALACEKEKNIFFAFGFNTVLRNYYIFVGGGTHKHPFYQENDIPIILEILYNRYDYLEQLECFARNTSKNRQKKCLETIRLYKQFKDAKDTTNTDEGETNE